MLHARKRALCYYLKFSCLSTLAEKFKSRITKLSKKYGDPLVLNIQELITTNAARPKTSTRPGRSGSGKRVEAGL
jgi:hypothetical protein